MSILDTNEAAARHRPIAVKRDHEHGRDASSRGHEPRRDSETRLQATRVDEHTREPYADVPCTD